MLVNINDLHALLSRVKERFGVFVENILYLH